MAEEISNIPIDNIMNCIDEASRNVSVLLNRKLQIAPVLVKTVRKQESNDSMSNSDVITNVNVTNIITNYEIWKVFLDYEKSKSNECYVVISGDCISQGYQNNKWDNINYCGFYNTLDEAENEINGYLE